MFSRVTGITTAVNVNAVDFETIKLGSGSTLKFDDGAGAAGLLQTLGLNATLQSGSENAATGSTDLSDLTTRVLAYVTGDQIAVSGTNPDGTQVSDTFVYGTDGTTLTDLVDFVNNAYDPTQSNTVIDPVSGVLRMTAAQKEPASMSLSIGDAKGNTGSSTYPSFATVQDGQGPDEAVTSIDIVDGLGRSHAVTMTFARSVADPSIWDMTATMDPKEGVISGNTISTIRFNQDGSFNVIGGGVSQLNFLFNGIAAAQSVSVDLGKTGTFEGIAMIGNKTTVAATGQNGYATGSLLNIAFETGGNLQGFYTNGQTRTLDSLRVTLFPNEAGLLRVGDTLFVESPNSEDPIATSAGAAGAGIIRPGSLENSNVDIAEEFVKLITAQRGFQANSRVITTADEILAELVNIVR